MKAKTPRSYKGIIFAGCSFTWGQGLYYYSNLPSIHDRDDRISSWDGDVVTFSQIEYMKSIRYPRLVARELETFEVCQTNNGGSNPGIIKYWSTSFIDDTVQKPYELYFNSYAFSRPTLLYKDFEYIIFQITDWMRSPSLLTNPDYSLDGRTRHNDIDCKDFKNLLIKHNTTIDEYCHLSILDDLNRIKIFLQTFENNGVKALVLSWPDDMVSYIKKDNWYNERFITHEYKNTTYDSIETLIKNNLQLLISSDDFFEEKPMDDHPSKECHAIMANSVIRKIKGLR